MTSALNVADHLRAEMASDDPWKLGTNLFEQRRYAIILDMMRTHAATEGAMFERGLEIGCAAGVFTALLAPHCKSLHVVDVMPAAIERAATRLKDRGNITWEVSSVTEDFAAGKLFDVIVVAEVLCYLPDHDTLRRAVDMIASKLAPRRAACIRVRYRRRHKALGPARRGRRDNHARMGTHAARDQPRRLPGLLLGRRHAHRQLYP